MSPRVHGLLADVEAALSVAGYLELDPDQALDDVVQAIDEAAAAGAGLPASTVQKLQAMLQDYRTQYAQRLELDSSVDARVRALLRAAAPMPRPLTPSSFMAGCSSQARPCPIR